MIPRPPGNTEELVQPKTRGERDYPRSYDRDVPALIEAQQQRFREGWRWHFAGLVLQGFAASKGAWEEFTAIDQIKQAASRAEGMIKELEGEK